MKDIEDNTRIVTRAVAFHSTFSRTLSIGRTVFCGNHVREVAAMSRLQLDQIVRRIGSLVEANWNSRDDGELLRVFRTTQDPAAFAEIIHRHGGLVMSVCRRVLCDSASAEDAWQATFSWNRFGGQSCSL